MVRWASISGLVICLSLVMSPGLAQAQGGLKVLETSVDVEFPSKLSFGLTVESDVDITDIRLHYTVDRVSFAEVISEVYIEFEPATAAEVEWTWDMRKTGGLPPGSSVEYWWTARDASGRRLETAPVEVQFDDTRYAWQSLTSGEVTLYWYNGDLSFVRELMQSVEQALARLAEETGAYLSEPVRIYIYANSLELRGAMVFPQEWTGGVAFTRYSTLAIGISSQNLAWGKGAITHELTHLVIHQMTLNPYGGLPTWLDEGLAVYNEGPLDSQLGRYLERAIAENGLISVRSLASPFSAHAEQSYLSYAQSYSVVEFLISSYGQGKMLELLNTFREGSTYDGALTEVYGFDMDGLNALWRDYISKSAEATEETEKVPLSSGALVMLPMVLGVAMGVRIRRRSW